MSGNIFNLKHIDDCEDKIDMDELFERKQQFELKELGLFKKILNQIHTKIKLSSRQRIKEQFLWFVVPEVIVGFPRYEQSICIAFLMDKLKDNDFLVNYYHPNLLYIYWGHVVPRYMRDEIKKKIGIDVDKFGNRIIDEDVDEEFRPERNEKGEFNYESIMIKQKPKMDSKLLPSTKKRGERDERDESKYADINSYNPTGNITYNKILSGNYS